GRCWSTGFPAWHRRPIIPISISSRSRESALSSADPREAIRRRAAALGFDVCRFASAAAPWTAGDRLHAFVEAGRHGEMGWMETTVERRSHPTAMWDGAKGAIVLGLNYGPDHDPLPALADRSAGYISVY